MLVDDKKKLKMRKNQANSSGLHKPGFDISNLQSVKF